MRTLCSPRIMALIAALLGAAALGVAFASEWWGGLVPCALCLWERWPYRVIIVLGALAAMAPRSMTRPLLGFVVLAFLVGAVLGGLHTGVEFRWWPSPLPECAAPNFGSGSIADRLAAMPTVPSKPCDDPTYLVPFMPLSMAAMNLLFALGAAGLVSVALWQRPRAR